MQPTIAADWALIGKAPGAPDDYGIRAASATDLDVRQFAWRYVAGVPDPDVPLDAPWAPPWVTFGTHRVGSAPMLSASVVYPWDGLDQAGRRIWPRLFIASRYEDIARYKMSYQTWYAAITAIADRLRMSEGDGRPIQLAAEPQPVDGIVGAIGEYGFERLAGIAALLLDNRRVAILGTRRLPLARRLGLLDAIVALLPYGCRADLSASSAVDRRIQHDFRLVFTEFPGDNQVPVPLTGSAAARPALETPAARRYHELLLDKGKERNSGLARVVNHLWRHAETYALSDPGSAVPVLEDLDRFEHAKTQIGQSPHAPLAAVLAFFKGEPPEVRRHWDSAREEDPGMPGKVFAAVLDSGDHKAAAILREHWDTIANDLAAFDNAELDHGKVDRVARSLAIAGLAQREERADWLLWKLLVPAGTPEPWHDPIQFRVSLLRKLTVPDPNELPVACNGLRFKDVTNWQGNLVHDLLTTELGSDETANRTIGWALWLCGSAFSGQQEVPDWVAALSFTVRDHADPAWGDSILSVIKVRAGWLVLILRLARQVRRLHAVLAVQGLDRYLIGTALNLADQTPGRRRTAFADALDVSLWEYGVPSETVAVIDVARVVLGGAPQDFPHAHMKAEVDEYLQGLERAFLALPNDDWRTHVQEAFLDSLASRADGSGRLDPAAVQLFSAWIKDPGIGPVLARYIKSRELGERLMSDSRLGRDFWAWLIEHDRDFQPYQSLVELHDAARSAFENPRGEFSRSTRALIDPSTGERVFAPVPGKFAQAMFNAWCSGREPEQIIAAIASTWIEGKTREEVAAVMKRATPSMLLNALREFQSLVMWYCPPDDDPKGKVRAPRDQLGMLSQEIWDDCLWLVGHAAALGPDYAGRFQVSVAAQSRRSADQWKNMERIFGPRRRMSLPGRSPESLFKRWKHREPPRASAPAPTVASPSLPAGASDPSPGAVGGAGTGKWRQ